MEKRIWIFICANLLILESFVIKDKRKPLQLENPKLEAVSKAEMATIMKEDNSDGINRVIETTINNDGENSLLHFKEMDNNEVVDDETFLIPEKGFDSKKHKRSFETENDDSFINELKVMAQLLELKENEMESESDKEREINDLRDALEETENYEQNFVAPKNEDEEDSILDNLIDSSDEEINENENDDQYLEENFNFYLRRMLENVETKNEKKICPAVSKYSSQCIIASESSLELDAEALDLCNRHELCYICSSALNIQPSFCDEKFINEAEYNCDADENCVSQANYLLSILRTNQLAIVDYPPPLCYSECVTEYIFKRA